MTNIFEVIADKEIDEDFIVEHRGFLINDYTSRKREFDEIIYRHHENEYDTILALNNTHYVELYLSITTTIELPKYKLELTKDDVDIERFYFDNFNNLNTFLNNNPFIKLIIKQFGK